MVTRIELPLAGRRLRVHTHEPPRTVVRPTPSVQALRVQPGNPTPGGATGQRKAGMLPTDEYLSREELETLKAILDEQLRELLSQSRDAVNELVEVRDTDADPLDVAVTESNRDFTLRMAERERKLLTKIRHALDRMANGEYGVCE